MRKKIIFILYTENQEGLKGTPGMLDSLPAAITAISSSLTILKATVALRDENKMMLALNDVYANVMSAQAQAVSALSQLTAKDATIKQLEEKIKQLQDWSAERNKYELRQISQNGTLVYVEKNNGLPADQAMKLCPNCFENGRKSILQNNRAIGTIHTLICQAGCPSLSFRSWS